MSKVVKFRQKGNFKRTIDFLKHASSLDIDTILNQYGAEGVEALRNATPRRTGTTAYSWNYAIHKDKNLITITWSNSNVVDGVPIAVILQYGHGTRHGGYVQGVDYINPAMKPIFDKIAQRAWEEVKRE